MKKNINHKLSGQNLLRFNQLRSKIESKNNVLISDSISLFRLFYLCFDFSNKFYLYSLELYYVSFRAYFSEFVFRFKKNGFNISVLVTLIYVFFKLFLFRFIFLWSSTLIVCSESRAKFISSGFFSPSNIIVVKNKPIIENVLFKQFPLKINYFLMAGQINSKPDFLVVLKFCEINNFFIDCYGQGEAERKWLHSLNSPNIVLHDKISYVELLSLYVSYLGVLCLYVNDSINQRYSASSKLFEILAVGGRPICSNNLGLKEESVNEKFCFLEINSLSDIFNIKHQQITNLNINNNYTFVSEIKDIVLND